MSIFDCPLGENLATYGTQETGQINVREYQGAIKNRQCRETGNLVFTTHITN
jgi:hypothetical protein